MKKNLGMFVFGLLVAIILVLYLVSFTIRWKEKGLVLTFGKISSVEDKPGLKWTWPWQTKVKFDGRIRTYRPKAYQIQTKDRQTIIVVPFVNWRISDVETFYTRFLKDATDESDIVAKAESIISSWLSDSLGIFAEYELGELVTLDSESFRLPQVELGADGNGGMLGYVRAKQDEKGGHGIDIVNIGIQRMGIPDNVSQAVFDRMRQERGAEERRLKAEGKRQADSLIGRAQSEATKIIADAQAKAKTIEGQADAEAAEYYAEFLANPELANFLRRLETLRKTLTNRTTIILDSDSPPYQLLRSGPQIDFEKTTIVEPLGNEQN